MAAILHKHRYPGLWLPKRQPVGDQWEIDWNHPLARGMVMCIPGWIAGRRDLAQINENTALATQNMLPSGLGYTNYTLTNAATTKLEFLSGGWAVGCFTHLNVVSTTSGQNPSPMARFSYTSESVNSGWQLIHAGGTTGPAQLWGMECFDNNAFGSYFTSGTSQATVGDVFLGMTSDGSTTRRLIVNGKQEATTAVNLNPITTTGALADFGAAGSFNGNYLMVAWNRDVSVGEWAWLNQEPYSFLRPALIRSRMLSINSGTGTGSLTLSASATETASQTATATGNLTLSAKATETANQTTTATGSLTLAAASTVTENIAAIATGSLALSAAATSTANNSVTATGGLTLGINALIIPVANIIGNGSITLSANATATMAQLLTSNAPMLPLGAAAIVTANQLLTANGSLQMNATAVATLAAIQPIRPHITWMTSA